MNVFKYFLCSLFSSPSGVTPFVVVLGCFCFVLFSLCLFTSLLSSLGVIYSDILKLKTFFSQLCTV